MRVVIIGGSGHVGTYLVPRLVELGYDVVAVSRGQREPYQPHAAWKSVTHVALDRAREEAAGAFGRRIGLGRGDPQDAQAAHHQAQARPGTLAAVTAAD